jgi:hypothetical protein
MVSRATDALMSWSVFLVRRSPTRAKKIEIRPAAAIALALIATIAGELPAKPIIVTAVPRKAMPRTSKRCTRNFSDLRNAALGADGTFTIPLLRLCQWLNAIGWHLFQLVACPLSQVVQDAQLRASSSNNALRDASASLASASTMCTCSTTRRGSSTRPLASLYSRSM